MVHLNKAHHIESSPEMLSPYAHLDAQARSLVDILNAAQQVADGIDFDALYPSSSQQAAPQSRQLFATTQHIGPAVRTEVESAVEQTTVSADSTDPLTVALSAAISADDMNRGFQAANDEFAVVG